MQTDSIKFIVIDDDPTGSQTVHSCPLLTRWTHEVVAEGLRDSSPLLFILSNTRACGGDEAVSTTREICRSIKTACDEVGVNPVVVSRSDSTLRGHFHEETTTIMEELGPFDALFLVPAFFEGGRVTVEGVHYVIEGDRRTRVDQTEFARDSIFAYGSSYLPEYVAEKTSGKIAAKEVLILARRRTANDYYERLLQLTNHQYVAVDADGYGALGLFAEAAKKAIRQGKRFLFRSAASMVAALAALPEQPVPPHRMAALRPTNGPGVVIVGSHVATTSEQLRYLLLDPETAGIEFELDNLHDGEAACVESLVERVATVFAENRTPVVYTSRVERKFGSAEERLRFGQSVSRVLTKLSASLPLSSSFLITKGGITSHDILAKGLGLSTCRVVGQIAPGCTVVLTPDTHRIPKLPVVIFPGNVGNREALHTVYRQLNQKRGG